MIPLKGFLEFRTFSPFSRSDVAKGSLKIQALNSVQMQPDSQFAETRPSRETMANQSRLICPESTLDPTSDTIEIDTFTGETVEKQNFGEPAECLEEVYFTCTDTGLITSLVGDQGSVTNRRFSVAFNSKFLPSGGV